MKTRYVLAFLAVSTIWLLALVAIRHLLAAMPT